MAYVESAAVAIVANDGLGAGCEAAVRRSMDEKRICTQVDERGARA